MDNVNAFSETNQFTSFLKLIDKAIIGIVVLSLVSNGKKFGSKVDIFASIAIASK